MSGASRPKTSVDDPVSQLRYMRSEDIRRLERLGIVSIRDLLFHFPRYYLDPASFKSVADVRPGEDVIVAGRIISCQLKRFKGGKLHLVEARLYDGTGELTAIFFNQQFMTRVLTVGTEVCLRGKVQAGSLPSGRQRGALPHLQGGNYVKMVQPLVDVLREVEGNDEDKMEQTVHTRVIVPVHAATADLSTNKIRRFVKRALDLSLVLLDPVPPDVLSRHSLVPRNEALTAIHFPLNKRQMNASRRRFLFEELFLLQVGLAIRRYHYENHVLGISHQPESDLTTAFRESLTFTLTGDQEIAIGEIARDMERDKPMSRLLQGEVGSGKTIVAFAAMLISVQSGHQAAFMAPTEILADQHYEKIKALADPLGVKVSLLTGSISAENRQLILYKAARGEVDIIIGTHALIQESVHFQDLSLVVVDEQHRFGVKQRRDLREKGREPDLLLMTATPIPRTIALTFYGDLETSTIKELPGGRSVFDHIKTYVLPDEKRDQAYTAIRREVTQGRQAFIVCPLVEASEKTEAKAVLKEGERLKNEVFPDLRVGHIHGKLKPQTKDAVMRDFAAGELDVLIASTVIEVGIDVPNATVMVIENADRFGLSQLHQLRGRVGRGGHPGMCILFSDLKTEDSRTRLKAMKELKDGFALAEIDLEIRGEGQLFGARQSGLPDLKLAKLARDLETLKVARREAFELVSSDPDLKKPEHAALLIETRRLFGAEFEWLFYT